MWWLAQEKGRPMSLPDGQIAAIAQTNHMALATRNITDFEACGIQLINPFEV
jgi:predicted nucleic acid-binding protein